MTRKRILHLIETSEPGGAETVLTDIARRLNPDRYRSLVCVLEEGWLTDRLGTLDIPFVVIENRTPYDPVFLYRLQRLIRRERISLMHSHEFMMTVYGSLASRLTGVPLIGTVHGKVYFPERKRRVYAFRLAASHCAKVIAVSDDLRRYLVSTLGFNRSRVMTLHNGIDLTRYSGSSTRDGTRRRFDVSEGSLVAGTAGSLFAVKGLEYLLEAAAELRRWYPSFTLLIAGEGNQERTLKEMADSLDLGKTVRFLGFCNDIPDFLGALDVYVCSSVSEGLSLSILEAMAESRPVVATDVGGNPELIRQGENGFLVPPADPGSLAARIKELFDDPMARERFGKCGRRIVEENFSLERMIRDYETLYEKVLP